MIVRHGELVDIGFIMETERLPGYAGLVGQWSEEAHEAEMACPDSQYLILERDGEKLGFALLQDVDEPNGNVLLRRIAVKQPGLGAGTALLKAVGAWVFARPTPHRLYLHVHGRNARAIAVYDRAGFSRDGVEREGHLNADGTREDNYFMSILRHEWEARA